MQHLDQKQQQGGKCLFLLTLLGPRLSREVKVGTPAEAMMECCFSACSLSDAQLASFRVCIYSPGPST